MPPASPVFAHISDLHFRSDMSWPPPGPHQNADWAARLAALATDLKHVSPDALFVTGDIADNSAWELTDGDLEKAWQNAHAYLEAVARSLFGDQDTPQATLEADGFTDIDTQPNVLRGQIDVQPPATAAAPRDITFGMRGLGVYTFSEDYCRWYKGTDRERFMFRVTKAFEALRIEIEFAEPFLPTHIEPEVHRPTSSTPLPNLPSHELLRQGYVQRDDAETATAWENFVFRRGGRRAALYVRAPLPHLSYGLTWRLPPDEYGVLDDPGGIVRGAIEGIHGRLRTLDTATHERAMVLAFLERCGRAAGHRFRLGQPVRVDIAIPEDKRLRFTVDKLRVVAAVQGHGATWQPSALKPVCDPGRTLRGKAYLQRELLRYAPGIADSAKDPNRDPMERDTKHQVAVPVVFPRFGPWCPRVAVIAFSWDSDSPVVSTAIQSEDACGSLTDDVHEQLLRLVNDFGMPFPRVTLHGDADDETR